MEADLELLKKVGQTHAKPSHAYEDYELVRRGAKIFKRRVVGFCGRIAQRSLAEMLEAIKDIGMADSEDCSAALQTLLSPGYFEYGNGIKRLTIKKIQDKNGGEVYEVKVIELHPRLYEG